MEPNQDRALIPLPANELAGPLIGGNRILGQMVDEVLARGRVEADVEIPRFRIGEYMWCEAEYRQILFWAEALSDYPSGIIERLIARKGGQDTATHFQEGRIFSLYWSPDWLPKQALNNLALPNLTGLCCFGSERKEIDLSGVSNLTRLDCSYNFDFTMIDLSSVPNLTLLDCAWNTGLTQLDLSKTPKLSTLLCDWTRFTTLNLFHTPNLRKLNVSGSAIRELNLSLVPDLRSLCCSNTYIRNLKLPNLASLIKLDCNYNFLTALDLSGVPNLTKLDCSQNDLSVLDIRPLRNLVDLKYDSDRTRLIQRPDQNF